MIHPDVRVIPDSIRLSQALQSDMQATALRLREAVYEQVSILEMTIRECILISEIKEALVLLDFPHFIPIDNTIACLLEEEERLRDLSDYYWEAHFADMYNIEATQKFDFYLMQLADVSQELSRRLGCTKDGEKC